MSDYTRLSMNLTPRVAAELDGLMVTTELSKTDVVNRAISLYALIEQRRADGQSFAFHKGDYVQVVEIL